LKKIRSNFFKRKKHGKDLRNNLAISGRWHCRFMAISQTKTTDEQQGPDNAGGTKRGKRKTTAPGEKGRKCAPRQGEFRPNHKAKTENGHQVRVDKTKCSGRTRGRKTRLERGCVRAQQDLNATARNQRTTTWNKGRVQKKRVHTEVFVLAGTRKEGLRSRYGAKPIPC